MWLLITITTLIFRAEHLKLQIFLLRLYIHSISSYKHYILEPTKQSPTLLSAPCCYLLGLVLTLWGPQADHIGSIHYKPVLYGVGLIFRLAQIFEKQLWLSATINLLLSEKLREYYFLLS